ncbi:MAG: hypothetical protein RLY88_377 [Actinomycetota bacterium]|jgi:uncharacterized membrane protein YhaH (DUF805 family)
MNEKISFAGAVKRGLQKYVNFRGVATRAEYWYFVLFVVLLTLVSGTFDQIAFPELMSKAQQSADALMAQLQANPGEPNLALFQKALADNFAATPISNFVGLATGIPLLTVQVRRMRDAGFGGWWLLLVWLNIFTFIVCLLPSKARPSA